MEEKIKPTLSKEDLELLQVDKINLSDYLIKDLFEHIESENYLTKVLYGQLQIESIINSILENGTYNYSRLNLDKMPWGLKISIATAQGLIDLDIEPCLQKLGNIRNKLAHNISKNLEKNDELDFINVLKQSRLREGIKKSKIKFTGDFSRGLFYLWLYLFEQLFKICSKREKLFKIKREIVSTDFEELINNAPKSFSIALEKHHTAKLSSSKYKVKGVVVIEKLKKKKNK